MNIYGIINPDFCNQIKAKECDKTIFKPGDLLSFFKYCNLDIENDYHDIFQVNFSKGFRISSEFEEDIILSGTENLEEIQLLFTRFKSLYLSIFCSAISNGLYDNVFITGSIDFKHETAITVKELNDKFKIVKTKIKDETLKNKKNLFLYISDEDITFDNENTNLTVKRFENKTPLSSIIFFLTNTCSVSAIREKQIFINMATDFIEEKDNPIKEINCFFTGTDSSKALFSPLLFETVNKLIPLNESLIINIFQLRIYSSKERTNNALKQPEWFGGGNKQKLYKLNETMSIFDASLTPALMQLSDSILVAGNDKIKLNLKTIDNKDFLIDNTEMQSCFEIAGKNKSFFAVANDTKISILQKDKKQKDFAEEISKTIENIKKAFCFNSNTKNNTKNNFVPFVISGFPGIGKTETNLKLARIESHKEHEKIISSDDRINNAAFADSKEIQKFRNNYDWLYLSRDDCKKRVIEKHEDVDDYKTIEYNYRAAETQNSISLAKILHARIDLGAKECQNALTRYTLFKYGYTIFYLTLTPYPLDEETLKELHNQKFDLVETEVNTLIPFENSWYFFKSYIEEIYKNEPLFNSISNYCFEDYYEQIFCHNPAMADRMLRRNFFDAKNRAMNKACETCTKECTENCTNWKEQKNQQIFKDFVHNNIWNARFKDYCKYCHQIIVREKSVSETAGKILKILEKNK